MGAQTASGTGSAGGSPPLLLSVDFEDWHQLVRRRIGVADWERPGPALPGQTARLLDLLDELEAHATFFILGMSARAHPGLVEQVAARGHEIGCHGDQHRPVHSQSRDEFAGDLRRARATIEALAGQSPVGYRAPAFSITRHCPWAYDVLVEEGFRYDSSQNDSPRIRQRVVLDSGEPRALECASGTLWEFPLAVWRGPAGRLPLGGASYWALLPTRVVLVGLARAERFSGLYLHPQELDPEPLAAALPPGASLAQRLHGTFRGAQRNLARRRAADVLRAIAGRHRLITYGEAHAQLADRAAARTQ
jgi:polysaccharide deacetylase family protein (PEP-CTERM system associated)